MIIYLLDKPKFDWKKQCALCGTNRINLNNYYNYYHWRSFLDHWEWHGVMNENEENMTPTMIIIPKEVTTLYFCNDCYSVMHVPSHLQIMSGITGWPLK